MRSDLTDGRRTLASYFATLDKRADEAMQVPRFPYVLGTLLNSIQVSGTSSELLTYPNVTQGKTR